MLVTVNEVRFRVEMNEGRHAAPIVFLHSLGTDLNLWSEVAEVLSPSFQSVRLDLRGHGGSDVPKGPYSIIGMADDVIGILEALGIDSPHLVGISLGGAVAQVVAANLKVSSLVLLDTALDFSPGEFWVNRAADVRKNGLHHLIETSIGRWVSKGFIGSRKSDELRLTLQGTAIEGYAASAEALSDIDLSTSSSRLTIPTLIIVGELDRSTPVESAKALNKTIPGSQLVILPGLAHFPPAEAPMAVAAAIEAFIDGLPQL